MWTFPQYRQPLIISASASSPAENEAWGPITPRPRTEFQLPTIAVEKGALGAPGGLIAGQETDNFIWTGRPIHFEFRQVCPAFYLYYLYHAGSIST